MTGTNNWEWYYDPFGVYSNGGDVISAKLSSVWGSKVTTTFLAGYNNKGGNSEGTYDTLEFKGSGPRVEVYEGTRLSGGLIRGTGLILEGGNRSTESLSPASLVTLRGDLTYFTEGWGGSHEVQTGFFLEPRNTYDVETRYTNNGFILERQVPVDPSNPAAGTRPFQRQRVSPTSLLTRQARDLDYGFYGQDSWRPHARLTANIGLRADYVKRVDKIFDVTRESAWTIQPRLGVSYMVTRDARDVLRASYARVGEQVMGRDAITSFGSSSKVSFRNEYDNNLDGVFETVVVDPAVTAQLASYEIDPDAHQPYIDEFIVGYRKQFPWQTAIDVAWFKRIYKDTWAEREINGLTTTIRY